MADADSIGARRVCVTCQVEKELSAFRLTGGSHRRQCKRCDEARRDSSPEAMARRAEQQKARRQKETPEQRTKRAADIKAYAERNRDTILDNKREYYLANVERFKDYREQRYADPAYRERMRAKSREWRQANPERKAEANRAWAQANPERMAAYFRESKAKRRQNPCHRLYESIGTQIRIAIGEKKAGRRWESLVGYTLDDLVAHLSRQMLKGMTWENYGDVWHIDHIVAQADFELDAADDATTRACWALSNLRPLWSLENLSKGRRRTHLL